MSVLIATTARERRGGPDSGLRGKARVTQRQRTLSVFGHQCAALIDGERCVTMGRLEIHHVDGDRQNDASENRVPLCRPHHLEFAGMPREAIARPVEPWVAEHVLLDSPVAGRRGAVLGRRRPRGPTGRELPGA